MCHCLVKGDDKKEIAFGQVRKAADAGRNLTARNRDDALDQPVVLVARFSGKRLAHMVGNFHARKLRTRGQDPPRRIDNGRPGRLVFQPVDDARKRIARRQGDRDQSVAPFQEGQVQRRDIDGQQLRGEPVADPDKGRARRSIQRSQDAAQLTHGHRHPTIGGWLDSDHIKVEQCRAGAIGKPERSRVTIGDQHGLAVEHGLAHAVLDSDVDEGCL